jgi:hypothetical protein
MKLRRLSHDPGMLIQFFEDGLTALGAVCERVWHDRLELVAEGRAASLWNPAGDLVEKQLRFAPADATGGRDADTEVFPGCPLTFRLAETLRGGTLQVERMALEPFDQARPPACDAVERLWHAQFPGSARWRLAGPFQRGWHFFLLLLARCEIQALDQQWSLHRLALSFSEGRRDDSLAEKLDFAQVNPRPDPAIIWPAFDLARWQERIAAALNEELADDLARVRVRQENYLRRELDRIDDYFENYGRELQQRSARSRSADAQLKLQQRLDAARAEHQRRRSDQLQRHEIRVIPHLDAALVIAEPAWDAIVSWEEHRQARHVAARFLPRARRWFIDQTATCGTAVPPPNQTSHRPRL